MIRLLARLLRQTGSGRALAYVANGDSARLERHFWPNDVPMRDRVMLSPEGKVTWL